MAIYTKTGDKGETSLVGGTRVRKTCQRLEAYGTVDELNSCLGLLVEKMHDEKAKNGVVECQNELFNIGARLASPTPPKGRGILDTTENEDKILSIERYIDEMSVGLPKWRGFTLPGGSESASVAHVCRTVCRRAEREILRLNEEEPVDEWILKYVNRLSDLLYVLALRENNLQGKSEVLWKK